MDFSLAVARGLLSSCRVRAAHCGGLLVAEHRLPDSMQAQYYGHRPGCSGTCGFSDWASALSLLHWQADSFPLSHPGSPVWFLKWRKHTLFVHEVEDKDDTKWEGTMGNKSALITRVCVCMRMCVSIVRGGNEMAWEASRLKNEATGSLPASGPKKATGIQFPLGSAAGKQCVLWRARAGYSQPRS